MSQVADLVMCSTCGENPARSKGECTTCSVYRYRTGLTRPTLVILAHFQRRASASVNVGPRVLTELHATLLHVGTLRPGDPRAEVLCAPCGTVTAWPKDAALPLCYMHRGWLALVGAVLDEPSDVVRIMEAMSA